MTFRTEVSGPPLSAVPSGEWIFERIGEWARKFPDQFAFALDRQDRVEEYRYSDVLSEADRVAQGLLAHDIHAGDRIGILMETIPQWVFVLLGAMRFGAITVPLATTLPESHVRNIAAHSGCRIIFADEPNLEKACNVAAQVGAQTVAVSGVDSRALSWDAFRVKSDPVRRAADGAATVLLIYTSGTTGDPKGVELTMLNLIYEISGIVEPFEMSSDHRILSVLPFSHVLPLVANALGPLCLGAGVVFLASISPQRIIEAFHRHRITCFICVPQFFYLLHKRIFSQVAAQPWWARLVFKMMRKLAQRVNHPRFRRKLFAKIHKTIGPDLRLFASGGSRFDAGVAADLTDLGYTVLNAYGLTETSAAVTATPASDNRIGTVGKPIRGVTIRIESPNNEGVGEVCIRGPLLMKGYYRDETHASDIVRDGWLHTGDLGFIDDDGNLTITGRSKDVIVLANGKNIYPEELETHYAHSRFIKEICILGVLEKGSEIDGEKLHAIVVPEMDEFRRVGQSVIAETIHFEMETLAKSLPSYQHVMSVSIRNEPFPRTVTRKLKRFEIQAEESESRRKAENPERAADHLRFQSGVGQIVASLVRAAKPGVGALDPASNIELDLGFDSLLRVELLTDLETRTGSKVGDEEAARIYTLGELLDALERNSGNAAASAHGWKEILAQTSEDSAQHYIFKSKPIATAIVILIARIVKLVGVVFFRLRIRGVKNIPPAAPFLICPNHESFLDAPMLYAALPSRVIANSFGLGYSNYWTGPITRRIAEACNIVAVDPNVHLTRALQAGAAGLRGGKTLVIFPEGTRSIDGQLIEFKRGAAILAFELRVPIVPVGVNGTFEAWPRGGGLRLHPVEIVFGPPIDPGEFSNAADPHAALTLRLRDAVHALTRDLD